MKQTTTNESTPIADLIQNTMEEKKERDERKMELIKQKMEQNEKNVQLNKTQMEMKIMGLDTSQMFEEQKLCYSQKTWEILSKGLVI